MKNRNLIKIFGILLVFSWSFAFAQTPVLLDAVAHPKFVNPLKNALDPDFIFQPVMPGGSHYEVGMHQIDQSLGLVDPLTGVPLVTTVWGYGTAPGFPNATFPGRTFVVQRDQQITVQWTNNLVNPSTNNPLPHLLPVDNTLHWAFSLPGYTWNTYLQHGVPVVPHVHGGHTESDSDGLPEYWWTPGESIKGPRFIKSLYTYDNDQPAGTMWYHDHGLGITRLNVYAGLAGFYIIRDGEDTGTWSNPLGLPAHPYEIPLVIQDRLFTTDGQLFYPTTDPMLPPGAPDPSALPEFFGDFIIVNGQAWPVANVEPRLYRLRFLNGSDSRFYEMFFATDTPILFNVIGTDNALLGAPVPIDRLTFGPGERYDVLVDFSAFAGQTIILRNNARSPFPKGATVNPKTDGQIMAFTVSTTVSDTRNNSIPATLRPVLPITDPVVTTRKLALFEGFDSYGRLQPMLGVAEPTSDVDGNLVDGSLLWDEMHYAITENPGLNEVEIWEVYNATADAHPIHLHLVSFQILGRQKYKADLLPKTMTAHDGSVSNGFTLANIRLIGKQKAVNPEESGWKDTAIMYPGEVTRIIAKFDRPGRYVWHCHILSHEDHEMMRPYHVGPLTAADKRQQLADAKLTVPAKFSLEQNYPNPFNPTTDIRFSLPEAATVELKVYNSLGQEVITLARGNYEAGEHSVTWDAHDNNDNRVSSGIYIYKLTSGKFTEQRKMMLLK